MNIRGAKSLIAYAKKLGATRFRFTDNELEVEFALPEAPAQQGQPATNLAEARRKRRQRAEEEAERQERTTFGGGGYVPPAGN